MPTGDRMPMLFIKRVWQQVLRSRGAHDGTNASSTSTVLLPLPGLAAGQSVEIRVPVSLSWLGASNVVVGARIQDRDCHFKVRASPLRKP